MFVELADSAFAVGVMRFGVSFLRAIDRGSHLLEQFTFGALREVACLNRRINGAA